jgi:hypothetical protein
MVDALRVVDALVGIDGPRAALRKDGPRAALRKDGPRAALAKFGQRLHGLHSRPGETSGHVPVDAAHPYARSVRRSGSWADARTRAASDEVPGVI